jgi:hypothetical protein
VKGRAGVAVPAPVDERRRERASASPEPRTPPASDRVASHPESRRAVAAGATSLALVQHWLMGAITRPDEVTAPHDLSAASEVAKGVDGRVLPSRYLSAANRVDIYREAYRLRLTECLLDDYPALANALGEGGFASLARAYIAAHPSHSPNLNFYGRHLSAYCRASASVAARAAAGPGDPPLVPFAADLAALEWALVEVLHAPAPRRLSAECLSSIPPARWAHARLLPSATLRVVSSAYAVNAYYQAWRLGEGPATCGVQREATAVFRDGVTLWRMDLSPAMEMLLRAFLAGATLNAAFDELTEARAFGDSDSPDVMRWFREWVGHGFFADIAIEPGP